MRAFRVDRPGDARLVDIPVPTPGPGEVLVQVEAVGICGSDLELVRGTRDAAFCRFPIVPGHEWAGVIAESAPHAPHLQAGTRVVVEGHHFAVNAVHAGQAAPTSARGTTSTGSHGTVATGSSRPLASISVTQSPV